ncbi:MAG TPA: NAD(P)/FAD-dependent oxidoreductase [Candidatus Dormibacteraeota bacterium]|nr:NAD(P)/FAD-dependent oxidoreductase [Candidatus Dormibacteraeota bacterium]
MATTHEYDALIVGARVAGSSLAIRLAQQGRRVLVIDRDRFPSDIMSTHFLNFTAVDSLRRLGALDAIEAAGFQRLYRHRTWIDDISIDAPAGPPGAYSIAPRRIVLDQVLLERARESGAEVLEHARADALIVEDGTVAGAKVQVIGGEARDIRARLVVGADGKGSQVARWVGAESYNERPAGRPIYLGYFHGVTPLPEPAIELFFKSDRIGFTFPMRPDETLLCVETQAEEFETIRHEPLTWFLGVLADMPHMRERMRTATLEGKLLGIRSVENCFRKPYGPGWALTGDAAYVKDPCTGYGIGDALLQGFWLAKALGSWFDGADWESTMSDYQARRDTSFGALYEQTIASTVERDMSASELAVLRSILINQHDTRRLLHAVPRLAADAFDPLDQVRFAFIARQFEEVVEKQPVQGS